MSDVITIVSNATKARMLGADKPTRLAISTLLSYFVEGYEHTSRFQDGYWDGRSSFYSFKTDGFPAGFVPSVESKLRQLGHTVMLKAKRRPAPLGPPVEQAYAAVSPFGVDPRYDYQPETIRRLERHGMMIAQIATGGGKSMIARTAAKRIGRMTLFLTTRQVLMYQMKEGFEEGGFDVGVMGDGIWKPKKGVNVAMVQTIAAKLANPATEEKMRKILALFELVILEEAHEAGSNAYFDILNDMPNAHYRLSLTATPFMRGDSEANMRLMAVSGQIGVKVSEKMLINRGILARPIFRFADVAVPDKLKKGSSWQRAYDLGITKNTFRNGKIVTECLEAARYGLTGMVLIQRTEHGEQLEELCREKGLRVDYISGKDDQARRQRALTLMRDGELDVLIGSTILDVGVDVPAVGLVVLAGGGKAEVALRQRIGRGLRAKKTGPNVCMVLDFADAGNKHLRTHAKQRREIIDSTPGFTENVITADAFPYENLGFRPVAIGNR